MTAESGHQATLFGAGRLCLFGEHTDWAAHFGIHRGHCLVTGTDQGLSACAAAADEFTVHTPVPDDGHAPAGRSRQMSCRADAETLLAVAKDESEFFRYCAGVAHEILARFDKVAGLDLRITAMDLPLKRGVASSAAVCILVARAFDAVYGLELFPHELMELAYRGERLTGSQCGRMDQACIYGRTPVLLTFDAAAQVRVEPVFCSERIDMFFVDLGGRKNTVRILDDLGAAYPNSPELQAALGADNERIVRRAYRALAEGEAPALGRLMSEAQSIFDRQIAPASPEELAAPLLHEVLGAEELAPHVWGGKGVGSGGDGTAQFVARSEGDRAAAMAKIISGFPRMRCFELTIPAAGEQA